MEKIRLDIGCGEKIKAGFIGVDKRSIPNVKHKINLDCEKLPYDDESVDEVFTSHFLEHVSDVETVFLEMIRVVKVGGKITVKVPFYSSPVAFEPSHKAFFNPFSFNFFAVGHSTFKCAPTYLKYLAKPRIRFNYFKDFKDIFFKPFEFFANYFTNLYLFSFAFIIPAHEIKFRFVKVKRFKDITDY